MTTIRIAIACLSCALGCAGFAADAAPLSAEDVAARLAAADRPEADRTRDADRRPDQVIAFLGIEPGMTVVDLIAAGGYYTEVLALAVGPQGKVYAHNTAFALQIRDGANEKALRARLADDRLPQVERWDRELDALGFAPESIDAAFTALNFHDVHNGGGPEAARTLLESVYGSLKPGGLLGIIDHSGGIGDDAALHRIEESRVVEAARRVGFRLEATSEVLRHPMDDRTRNVFDPEVRGRTDRFVLLLRKPADG